MDISNLIVGEDPEYVQVCIRSKSMALLMTGDNSSDESTMTQTCSGMKDQLLNIL